MYQFRIMLLFILLGTGIYYKSTPLIIISLAFAVVWAISIPIYKKTRTSQIEYGIKTNNIKINLNRANWWEIALLPEISDALAKKIVWNKKKDGRYSSLDNFLARNEIKNIEKIKDFLEV